jgi:hypothetical protein
MVRPYRQPNVEYVKKIPLLIYPGDQIVIPSGEIVIVEGVRWHRSLLLYQIYLFERKPLYISKNEKIKVVKRNDNSFKRICTACIKQQKGHEQ